VGEAAHDQHPCDEEPVSTGLGREANSDLLADGPEQDQIRTKIAI
jgi:hypothetical protein